MWLLGQSTDDYILVVIRYTVWNLYGSMTHCLGVGLLRSLSAFLVVIILYLYYYFLLFSSIVLCLYVIELAV